MMLVSKVLVSRQLTSDIYVNDAFNICAASIGSGTSHSVIVCVYRPPWAKLSDTKDLCQALDNIAIKHERVIIVGDFNPKTCSAGALEMIQNLAEQHSLSQIARAQTRGSALLDLVYVSMQLINCVVSDFTPIAGSNHSAQLVRLPTTGEVGMKLRKVVNYELLELLLSHIESRVLFVGNVTVNDYALRLNTALVDAINASTL